MLEVFMVAAILLAVACALVRNRVEQHLNALRNTLMALRSEEKDLAQQLDEMEDFVLKANESIRRTEWHYRVMTDEHKGALQIAKEVHFRLKKEELILDLEGPKTEEGAMEEEKGENRPDQQAMDSPGQESEEDKR